MMLMKSQMIQQSMIWLLEMRSNMKDIAKWMNNVMKDKEKYILTSLRLLKMDLKEPKNSLTIGLWLMKKFPVGSLKLQKNLKIKSNMGVETDKENKSITLMTLQISSSLKCVNKMNKKSLKMLAQAILLLYLKKVEEESQNQRIKTKCKTIISL